MDTYFACREVQIAFPLAEGASVSALGFRVLNEHGEELHQDAPDVVDNAAVCSIPGAYNAVRDGLTTDYRCVELTSPDAEPVQQEYLIRLFDTLSVGVNSAVTYGGAMIAAASLVDVEWFMAASKESRESALASAYINLSTLRFSVACRSNFTLRALNPKDFEGLPGGFLQALQLAQVVEANEIMNPVSVHKKRQSGLMSETIGESSMMFRPGRVLSMPVTSRSMSLLRNYLSWEVGIGRA